MEARRKEQQKKANRSSALNARRTLDFGKQQNTSGTTSMSFYGSSRPRHKSAASRLLTGSRVDTHLDESPGVSPPRYWEPGETLPTGGTSPSLLRHTITDGGISASLGDVQTLTGVLQSFQQSMDSKLGTLCTKVDSISNRLDSLETRQKTLEDDIRSSASSSTSASPSVSGSALKRNRATPVALQSKIRLVHNSMDEVKQFRTSEPVNSSHNTQVVMAIITAIGDQYPEDIIRRGCKTYKKTLTERQKHVMTPVKRKKQLRSRKQRTFERRGRFVHKGREARYWETVTPDMMSDEEKQGTKYIRHQPDYRSERFNSFMNKLDERNEKQASSNARFKREIGSPVKKLIPSNAKPWMLKHSDTSDQEPPASDNQLPTDSPREVTDTEQQTIQREENDYHSDSLFGSDSAESVVY